MVFQDNKLLDDRSAYENVALPLIINGTGEREIGRRVRAALDQVGLLDRERYPPRTLSAGEQQRLGIARAIVSRPKVLIADEPTGNLDPDLALEVMALFKRLNEVGTTMLIASHDLHLVEHFGSPAHHPGRRVRCEEASAGAPEAAMSLVQLAHAARAERHRRARHAVAQSGGDGADRHRDRHCARAAGGAGRAGAVGPVTGRRLGGRPGFLGVPGARRRAGPGRGAGPRTAGQARRGVGPADSGGRGRGGARARIPASRGPWRRWNRTPCPTRWWSGRWQTTDGAALEHLGAEVRKAPGVDLVKLDLEWVERLNAVLDFLRRLGLITGGLLIAAVVIVVGNTIRLDIQNRSAEIEVAKLLGATDAFVRRPFLYLGLWYGLLGGLVAMLILLVGLWALGGPITRLAGLYGSSFELGGATRQQPAGGPGRGHPGGLGRGLDGRIPPSCCDTAQGGLAARPELTWSLAL